MKNSLNEELSYIKYLLKYDKGKTILEQKTYVDSKTSSDNVNARITTPSSPSPIEDEPKKNVTSTQQVQDESKLQSDLLQKQKTLEAELSTVQKNIDFLSQQQKYQHDLSTLSELKDRLFRIDSFLDKNCIGIHFFRGCRRYKKDRERINKNIDILQGFAKPEESSTDSSNKTKKAVGDVTLIVTAIGALYALYKSIANDFTKKETNPSGSGN